MMPQLPKRLQLALLLMFVLRLVSGSVVLVLVVVMLLWLLLLWDLPSSCSVLWIALLVHLELSPEQT